MHFTTSTFMSIYYHFFTDSNIRYVFVNKQLVNLKKLLLRSLSSLPGKGFKDNLSFQMSPRATVNMSSSYGLNGPARNKLTHCRAKLSNHNSSQNQTVNIPDFEPFTTTKLHGSRLLRGALHTFTLRIKNLLCVRIPHAQVFPQGFRFKGVLTSLYRCSAQFGSGRQMSRFFEAIKIYFLKCIQIFVLFHS
jgi:hypothetical protein